MMRITTRSSMSVNPRSFASRCRAWVSMVEPVSTARGAPFRLDRTGSQKRRGGPWGPPRLQPELSRRYQVLERQPPLSEPEPAPAVVIVVPQLRLITPELFLLIAK